MNLPVWRSLLFVPANKPAFVESCLRRGADGVILDLEDAVLPEHKPEARACVRAAAARIRAAGLDVLVRINQPLRLAAADLEATIGPDVDAIVLPKAQGAQHVALVAEAMEELERTAGVPAGRTRIVAMIEDPGALARAQEIASAPRVAAITVGAEDFSVAMGMVPEEDGLYLPNVLAVAAARAAGVLPIGYLASVALLDDLERYRAVVRRSRALGLAGGFCIHPRQVPVLNEEFAPAPKDLEYAARVIQAAGDAAQAGAGAFRLDGRMVDRPIVERARALLARQAAIEARAARSPAP